MGNSRLEILTQLVEKNPKDSFALYGLAMECVQQKEFDKAIEHFRKLSEVNPDYAPTYYQAGQLSAKMGRIEDARRYFEKGIEVTTRSGNLHAKSELEAALAQL